MTLERGQSWGRAAPLPPDGVVASSDADAARAVAAARAAGTALPAIGLIAGDLCRTLGGTGDVARLHTSDAVTVPIDVAEVEINGETLVFLAHVVAHRSWWRGQVWAAMNAEWLGSWDVAPRAHPGDGLLDIFDVSLGVRDRVRARRRLATGTHVPHPDIAQRRVPDAHVELDRPLDIWVDGRRIGTARDLSVRVTGELVDVIV